jgi:hypothetical protein
MVRKLLPLALLLALATAACAEPPNPEIEFGSGTQFVPFVADSLNNAGIDPSMVVGEDGLPVITYFGFEEQTAEGELPDARPVDAPTLPGVLMTTANRDGIWTRGAMAIESQIPSVNVPFNPAFEPTVADLTAGNLTGLQVVADGTTLHAVWGSGDGLYYARSGRRRHALDRVLHVDVLGGHPRPRDAGRRCVAGRHDRAGGRVRVPDGRGAGGERRGGGLRRARRRGVGRDERR